MNARVPQLYVESLGDGPPLVLLHGFAMHGGLFEPLLPALTPRFRVHVVDLPGHGRSPSIDAFGIERLAATIDDATVPIEQPLTVLGWSLGGQAA
ncbi:MAG TPA: alpha/beta fold hydrolase, partial [Casimicrobiaceae bacterium]|nr:alpha/beta fold hydrolase [Casimicrobiaceae bacterium]